MYKLECAGFPPTKISLHGKKWPLGNLTFPFTKNIKVYPIYNFKILPIHVQNGAFS